MRIGIDARALSNPGSGEETYIRNVIRALASIDAENDYTLFVNPQLPDVSIPNTERMRRVVVRPSNRSARLLFSFPLALWREQIDVAHAQNVIPVLCPAPAVASVHDIAYERYPQFFVSAEAARLRMLMPLMVRWAKAILTLSEFSKQDIVRRYRVPPEKIMVAPGAAEPIFHRLDDPARVVAARVRYGTGERFILYVGNLQPRKNLKTLIEAYVQLRRADAVRHKLIIVGSKTWLYDDIFAAARASGYEEEIVFTGYVPDEDLVALYNGTELFVYPSIFEGFGLPVLEAMACGAPVITSNTSSFPEVVGAGAMLVDPLDAAVLAKTMVTVLGDSVLRASLSSRAMQEATRYSWETTARIVLAVYQAVYGR